MEHMQALSSFPTPEVLPQFQKFLLLQLFSEGEHSHSGLSLLPPGPCQVILCVSRDGSALDTAFLSALAQAEKENPELILLPLPEHTAMVLFGNVAINKFSVHTICAANEDRHIGWVQDWNDRVIFAFGPSVESPSQLSASYQRACCLLKDRFFYPQRVSILKEANRLDRSFNPPVLTSLLLEHYAEKILKYIQTFNRSLMVAVLQDLKDMILQGNETAEDVRLFAIDLYLQVKDQMKLLYQGSTIPFYTNSHIIQTVFSLNTMEDIFAFLAHRFDMVIASIGASSRESVLDDILNYIRHNYNSNITLESIAPLFGYNHSYLGKIFRKKMNMPFNEYVDRLRIEKAQDMLLQDNAKVYAIAEQVGYKNVDYFHVKFRKYVNMSPAQYRKLHKDISHSPVMENVEKGSLFR